MNKELSVKNEECSNHPKKNEEVKKNDFIDGEFEDIDDNDDRKF